MTDTSAPERIFAKAGFVHTGPFSSKRDWSINRGDWDTRQSVYTSAEYTRSDISEARIAELTAERDALASALIAIKHYRKSCHDHDDDMGHDRRDFDKEDLILMETMASSVLKAFSIPESTP